MKVINMLTNPDDEYVINSAKKQVLLSMFLLQYQIGSTDIYSYDPKIYSLDSISLTYNQAPTTAGYHIFSKNDDKQVFVDSDFDQPDCVTEVLGLFAKLIIGLAVFSGVIGFFAIFGAISCWCYVKNKKDSSEGYDWS